MFLFDIHTLSYTSIQETITLSALSISLWKIVLNAKEIPGNKKL